MKTVIEERTTASRPADTEEDQPALAAFLKELHAKYAPLEEGEVADYIPELAKADPDWFGIVVVTVDGRVLEVGSSRQRFTIQSASKPFTYGLALEEHGTEYVLRRVGVEPTGDAFNSIVLDEKSHRPYNPMVNAGAIATTDMVSGADATERLNNLLQCFRRYVGRADIYVDLPTFTSERATGHRNRAVAHLMRAGGMMSSHFEESLDLYFQQCSLLVNCRDLAVMAATLANGGRNPVTGEQAVAPHCIKNILSVMYTCGMYDFAGEWAYNVGIPAKSGVSGGILAVVPGQMGIGVFSPRVDLHGNSVRGVRVCEDLSETLGLHLFDERRTVTNRL